MSNQVDTFSGEEQFAVPADVLFAAVTNLDPQGPLAKSVPDVVSAEQVQGENGQSVLQCKVKPGFSFIRATMKLTIELSDVDTSQRATKIHITSAGIGNSMKVQCSMKVNEAASGSDSAASSIAWEANVLEKRGLIAAVSPALIRGAADTVIRDGWASLRKQVEG